MILFLFAVIISVDTERRMVVMPRKGENIYIRKDGRWEGRYIIGRSVDGKAIYKSLYAKSYKEVREKIKNDKQNQYELISKSEDTQHNSFEEIARKWFDSREHQIKESTRIKYRNMLQRYILPYFKNLEDVKSITHETMDAFVKELLTAGGKNKKGLSEKTVADIISIMRLIEKYAISHGMEMSSFCADINIKYKPNSLNILSVQEEEKILNHLEKNMDNRNFGIYLCLFTGIRLGELCALTWEDLSVKEKVLYVHSTMQRIQIENPTSNTKTRIITTSPKSNSSIREIPLSDGVLEIITDKFKGSIGYVLTGNCDKYIEPRAMEYYFKRICESCEIRIVNFHVLRHTFATRCVEAGCDVKSLSEILGHSSVNMTMNRYVHPSMDLKRKSIELHSGLFAVRN